MAKTIKIRDLTLRDGQQSSFATRMTQAQIDRCLPYYKDANFYAMEVWGGAVPDSVMRYLNENPWTRLETIHKAVGGVSKLTALSRGRNLFGYAPYTDQIIDGFCRNAIQSGLGIMRIFDALNDVNNVKSTIKYVKQYGGIADCAVCYTVDPKYPEPGFFARLTGKKKPRPVFTDAYFLDKAEQMAALGADMITIKDMSGLIPPMRVSGLVKLLKQHVDVPIDFHTHCTPGYGLASVLSAILAGADIVDTNCWYFAEGTGAPAIELIYVFCKKLGIELQANMEAVAKINGELKEIRRELELSVFGAEKPAPKAFDPLTDTLPAEIDAEFDKAIAAAKAGDEAALLAGYDLIHVDPTVDINVPAGQTIDIRLVAARTVELIRHCETFRRAKGLPEISYEVGTEEVHGGLADERTFDTFIAELKAGLAREGLSDVWPCFIVGKVGTDLHTTLFDTEVARSLTAKVRPLGSYIKGHYTDGVSNPQDYPLCGMGAANVGPEFTMSEYDGLAELERTEQKLLAEGRIAMRSRITETLERLVEASGRWKKWLLPAEEGSAFGALSAERRTWLVKTGCRYIWQEPEALVARQRLYDNLRRVGMDPEEVVLGRIEHDMDKYFYAFNLVDLNNLL